jgi:hypothetical protein
MDNTQEYPSFDSETEAYIEAHRLQAAMRSRGDFEHLAHIVLRILPDRVVCVDEQAFHTELSTGITGEYTGKSLEIFRVSTGGNWPKSLLKRFLALAKGTLS